MSDCQKNYLASNIPMSVQLTENKNHEKKTKKKEMLKKKRLKMEMLKKTTENGNFEENH